jgi:hypothetical protein
MSFLGLGLGALGIGSLISGFLGADAEEEAAAANAQGAQRAIEEQRRQFDQIQKLYAPYIQKGTGALDQIQGYGEGGIDALRKQQALAGILGPQAQQQEIDQISNSPFARMLIGEGEDAILQNAAATGGLRGGNVQNSLATWRTGILGKLAEDQFNKFGTLANFGYNSSNALGTLGQNSVAGQGSAGLTTGANIGTALGRQAQARGDEAYAQNSFWNAFPNALVNTAGTGIALKLAGAKGLWD